MSRHEYLLGDAPAESERLRHQAELWDPDTHNLLGRAGVAPGCRVLEIGPGAGSIHSWLRRRVGGPVDAVEQSAVFAGALQERSAEDGLGAGRVWCTDLLDAGLPSAHYDIVFARWVFLFLPAPARHLRKLVAALRPGGRLVIQDYAHRECFAILPRPDHWLDFQAAEREMFGAPGGDVSIASRLPALFRDTGLVLCESLPVHKSGPPDSEVWRWLWEYFLSVRTRYARIPPLTPAKLHAIERQWREAAADPQSLVIAPIVTGLIGQKPGGR